MTLNLFNSPSHEKKGFPARLCTRLYVLYTKKTSARTREINTTRLQTSSLGFYCYINYSQEPCVWKCKHFTCTNVCSDYCNRPPCYARCGKKLKCKHRCIGFCGEPCSPLCRVCDKDEVTKIIFGTEDEPNARYVFNINSCCKQHMKFGFFSVFNRATT